MKKELTQNSTVRQASDHYLRTPHFATLSARTQQDYETYLRRAMDTQVQSGKRLGNIKLKDVEYRHMTHAYATWCTSSIRSANYMLTVMGIVFNDAIRYEAMHFNPIKLVRKKKTEARTVRWERDHVFKFLDTAYSRFEWRSIGLIVHMAYTWGQRVGDMRLLEWSNIDPDFTRVDLVQRKRQANVHLPIHDNLRRMLQQQHEDFGFQDYVAPRTSPRNGVYSAYDDVEIHKLVNAVKAEANLPSKLTAQDLRRTKITEAAAAGADMANIMQFSGHSNPNSVRPYLVNTLEGAATALSKVEEDDKY